MVGGCSYGPGQSDEITTLPCPRAGNPCQAREDSGLSVRGRIYSWNFQGHHVENTCLRPGLFQRKVELSDVGRHQEVLKTAVSPYFHMPGARFTSEFFSFVNKQIPLFIPKTTLSRCLSIATKRVLANLSPPPPGFPGGLDGKESTCNAGYPGSIPGSGRSPREGNGNPLQYSCLENPMDRGAWTILGVANSQTRLSN